MYLLDTNICIALLKQNHQAVAEFNSKSNQCYLLTIVIAELYKGVYCSSRVEQNLMTLNQFIDLMPIVNFNLSAAIEFGKIQAELRRIGRPTGELDAMIAAVARSRGDSLVTDNIRHFENITKLQLENWLTP
ncbi:MAG TPA: twitching motility protein PilT [Cyanobacteria bacterium UBA8553]|nr:twitching motility protein PilT [Cyanobacteria bacterium UBA8553]HAJ64662.1 twitching motility protein PilT [Cyanobacteria bacterium UBA8543]